METVTVEDSTQCSFGKVANVTLSGFPALRRIALGNKSFPTASTLYIKSNPLLHTISFGNSSFNGDGTNEVEFTSESLLSIIT